MVQWLTDSEGGVNQLRSCEPQAFTRTTTHKGGGFWLTKAEEAYYGVARVFLRIVYDDMLRILT